MGQNSRRTKFSVFGTPVREILLSKFSEADVIEMLNLISASNFDEETGDVEDLINAPYMDGYCLIDIAQIIDNEGIRGFFNYAIDNNDSEIAKRFVDTLVEFCKSKSKETIKAVNNMISYYIEGLLKEDR